MKTEHMGWTCRFVVALRLAGTVVAGCSSATAVDGGPDTGADADGGDADGGDADEASEDTDGDGFTVGAGDCDDTDPEVYPGNHCPCPDGWWDCNGAWEDGCEARVEDISADLIARGCCHPFDASGNSLDDCDGDGFCECYGACSGDDPYTPEYERPECEGE